MLFSKLSTIQNYGWGDLGPATDISRNNEMQCNGAFGMDPFYIEKGKHVV